MPRYAATLRVALAAATLIAPTLAGAQTYQDGHSARWHRHHHYSAQPTYRSDGRSCGDVKRSHGNNGTAIGAVTGGVLGSAMGGGKLGNVLLGAGAGAVAGHVVGRGTVRC